MFLGKILTWKDLADNRIKKIIFILIGLIIFIIGIFLGIKLNIQNEIISRLYSLAITFAGLIYFIFPVIFLSFNEPVYLFKNNIVAFIFPLVFNWSSFIIFIYFGRTEKIAIISLILAFIGYIFSGIIPGILLNSVCL